MIVRERPRGRRLALADDGLVMRSTASSACSVPKLLTPRSGFDRGHRAAKLAANAQSIEATKDRSSEFLARDFCGCAGRNAGCIPRYHWGLSDGWLPSADL